EPMEHLSRGMQQKVALARALLTSPVLLLLDEPTTGLDPRSKQEVQEFIREIRVEHDATILLCTHDMDEAEVLADRIGILDRGERYIWWDVAFMLWTIANTLTIVFIARGVNVSPAEENALATKFLVGGVIWAFLGIIFEIVTETVAWERWEGTIEYTFMAPVS